MLYSIQSSQSPFINTIEEFLDYLHLAHIPSDLFTVESDTCG